MTQTQRQSWTFTEIRFWTVEHRPVSSWELCIPTVGPYELYYLFPLSQEQQTLDLVSSSIPTAGLVLVGLLGVVAWT